MKTLFFLEVAIKLIQAATILLVCYALFVQVPTIWWVATGHCCGMYIPYVSSEHQRKSCLPISDTEEFRTRWTKGVCNPDTGEREE